MVIIRSFEGSRLSTVSTWKFANPLGSAKSDNIELNIQINLIEKKGLKKSRQLSKKDPHTKFYFVATSDEDSQEHIKKILLDNEIIGLTQLLTDREVVVLKELQAVKNTKEAAANLHISARTFANHRFNVTKKLTISAAEAANLLFDCSSVDLFNAVLDDDMG